MLEEGQTLADIEHPWDPDPKSSIRWFVILTVVCFGLGGWYFWAMSGADVAPVDDIGLDSIASYVDPSVVVERFDSRLRVAYRIGESIMVAHLVSSPVDMQLTSGVDECPPSFARCSGMAFRVRMGPGGPPAEMTSIAGHEDLARPITRFDLGPEIARWIYFDITFTPCARDTLSAIGQFITFDAKRIDATPVRATFTMDPVIITRCVAS